MSNPNINLNFWKELDEKELETIVGGAASFLKGDISATLVSDANNGAGLQGQGSIDDVVAPVSRTILECWGNPPCTVLISTC